MKFLLSIPHNLSCSHWIRRLTLALAAACLGGAASAKQVEGRSLLPLLKNPKTMKLLALITTVVLAVLPAGPAHAAKRGRPTDDPKLPRVLLIGDSISMGYTPEVRTLLGGKANVHHNVRNGGSTAKGLENLKAWLGDGKWDVIHFNWGLHDLKFGNDGKNLVSPDEYEKNLRQLVKRLKATNAKLIWCATTTVPEGDMNPGRKNSDVIAYNAIARKIMDENGVAIDDLYTFALPQLKQIQLRANVHFSPAGSAVLAKRVVASIETALPKPTTP